MAVEDEHDGTIVGKGLTGKFGGLASLALVEQFCSSSLVIINPSHADEALRLVDKDSFVSELLDVLVQVVVAITFGAVVVTVESNTPV